MRDRCDRRMIAMPTEGALVHTEWFRTNAFAFSFLRTPGRIRTRDTWGRNPLLFPLSYERVKWGMVNPENSPHSPFSLTDVACTIWNDYCLSFPALKLHRSTQSFSEVQEYRSDQHWFLAQPSMLVEQFLPAALQPVAVKALLLLQNWHRKSLPLLHLLARI